jgi:hypothetical protein
MSDETRVFPDDEGNCPVGYHNMPADDDHETEWCMEGDEHPTEEMYSYDKMKETNSMIKTKETRTSTAIELEVRDEGTEETTPKVVGYPVVFDSLSNDLGFYDVTDSWAMLDGTDVRTINSARLFDVSIVTNPAYSAASVGLRTEPALRSLEAHKAQEVIDNTDFAAIGETTKLQFRLRLAEQDK